MSIANIAKAWAIAAHQDTNHKYDGKPYEIHLQHVVNIATQYLHYIPENDRDIVLAACWAHDTIEDCRMTYNDVKSKLGERVAGIVYALTNEKGKTRKDRANADYYRGIMITPYASFVKLCDRIANTEYSFVSGSRMAGMYAKEFVEFKLGLDKPNDSYLDMWQYLQSLCERIIKSVNAI